MNSFFKKTIISSGILLAFPLVTLAQFGNKTDLTDFGTNIINFINNALVPFTFGVALLFFIYGMFLYFIYGADSEESKKTGKSYIIWSIIALVLMVSVWGIVNLIAQGLNLDKDNLDTGLIPKVDVKR